MNRRSVIRGVTAVALATASGLSVGRAFAQPSPAVEEGAEPLVFSFEWLTETMRARVAETYVEPAADLPGPLADLSYDGHRAIRFFPDRALWKDQSPFELQAFHMGWLFRQPVKIFEVAEGQAREVRFTGRDFEYRSPLDPAQFAEVEMPGVAGFRLHYPLNRPDIKDELVAFLGASYFRALGRDTLYGLSARGLAVNTATSAGEEFPRFSDFYIERPSRDSSAIMVYAAMESPSLTGAYAFRITPGQTTEMEVTARLFIRRDIERFGVAPMTSMFLYAENNRHAFDDYRPQVHDSDGLLIVRANGEQLWRSLNNPKMLATSIFMESSPSAFGLYQRDREFDRYQDADAHYERRPSLRVEPIGDWGEGAVQLVEIPSNLEVNDNIVAFWVPEAPVTAGQELEYRYRLIWGDLPRQDGSLARVIALRAGVGGVSGVESDGTRKFVVDFQGGLLRNLPAEAEVVAKANISQGEIASSAISRIDGTDIWRLALDIRPAGSEPVEMNAHLTFGDRRLSETWLYQWRPDDDRR